MVNVWATKFGNYGLQFGAPKTGMSSMSDRPLYALPLEAHRVDLDRKKSPLLGDLELAALINEEFSGPMSFCYENVRGGEIIWGGGVS